MIASHRKSLRAGSVHSSRLSLKLTKKPKSALSESNSNRFRTIDSATAQKAAGGLIPRNTEFTTHWALRNFSAWAKHRCELVPDDPVPADLLRSKDPVVVCKYLRFYILETRKEDGTAYPPARPL